ncbi:hypothetical protein GDO81_003742 [Engystomops pustulosus]|uniref:Uncharacterized protein n=1 Tax=Engystomops pustulosus TaxID=76066 RepID=A0AAV6ZZ46_ENGPU|nr:hypothetical protein GDO81_003742 [Engystomops pustulosus]
MASNASSDMRGLNNTQVEPSTDWLGSAVLCELNVPHVATGTSLFHRSGYLDLNRNQTAILQTPPALHPPDNRDLLARSHNL